MATTCVTALNVREYGSNKFHVARVCCSLHDNAFPAIFYAEKQRHCFPSSESTDD